MANPTDEMRPLAPSSSPTDVRQPARPKTALLSGLLGLVLGLFGSVMLYYGVPGLVFVLRKGNRNSTAFAGDVFECAMFVIIGIVCAAIAIRWLRAMVKGLDQWAGIK